MNILITNDDGIHSKGIDSLFEVLSEKHKVFIIAPDEEKSACSSAITVRTPLQLKTISEFKYSINGFPADCVNVGLNSSILPEIELVISGINHGPNLGDDIFFSGTVAGARTAYIFGVSGIAISIDCLSVSDYFNDAAGFLLNFIRDFKRFSRKNPVQFNINYPDLSGEKIRGIKYTTMGRREYKDSYIINNSSNGEMSLQLNGTIDSIENDGSDATELRKGYISITPLTLDCTDYSYLNKLKNLEETWET